MKTPPLTAAAALGALAFADSGAGAARDGGWIFVTTSEPRRNEPGPRPPERSPRD